MTDVGRILDNLKPCPFCGGKAGRRFRAESLELPFKCIIQCMQCEARIETEGINEGINELSELEKMAIEKWNKRA